jgi:hypothetical protein
MPPETRPIRVPDPYQRILDELEDLTAVMHGSSRLNTPGVVPTLNHLQDEVAKLRASVQFLRIVCALLFMMTLFTMLAVIFLVQAQL